MQKKLLSIFLVLAMMISSLPTQPHVLYAEETDETDVIEVLNETEQEDDETLQAGDPVLEVGEGDDAPEPGDGLSETIPDEMDDVVQEDEPLETEELIVSFDPAGATYDGTDQTPTVLVRYGTSEEILSEENYTVGWKDASGTAVNGLRNAGTYTATVTGIGDYAGKTATADFTIKAESARRVIKEVITEDKTFTGSALTTVLTFKDYSDNVMDLSEGNDYDVIYSGNVNAGRAYAEIVYKGNLSGTDNVSFTINKADISKVTITLNPSSYVIGNDDPTVTVKLGSYVLPLTEYSFAFSGMDVPGTGTVTVTSAGVNLTDGTKEKTFTVANVAATITKDGTTTYYSSLKTAIAGAATGDTIVLTSDYTGTDFISYSSKNLTIDLAGHSYTRSNSGAAIQVSGSLTLIDSVGGGSLNAANGIGIETKSKTAVVTIESGTVTGTNFGISTDNATVTVNGGSVISQNTAGIKTKNGTITVNGGTVKGNEYGILEEEDSKPANITITGGTIACTGTEETLGDDYSKSGAIVLSDATTLAISGENTVISGGYSGIAVFDAANVTISDGSITGDLFGVTGNGSVGYGGYTINIEGGSITGNSAAAVYHPNDGTVNITDGTLTGPTAVYQKSGTLNITGGTLHATGEANTYAFNSNGMNPTGDALVIDNCGYPGGTPAPAVNGGTFVSDHADPIGSYAYGEENEAVGGFVSDGTFNGSIADACMAEGKELVLIDEATNEYGVQGATVHVTVADGTYVFNGSAIEPELTVQLGTAVLDPEDYTVGYSDNVNAGECTVTVTVGEQNGTAVFTIDKADFADVVITLAPEEYIFGNESAYEPAVTVKLGDYTLSADEYKVVYSDNTDVTDSAKATISPAGINFTGEAKTATFKIIAAAVKVGDAYFTTLQEALDAAHELTGDVTVILLEDIEGYAIVHQKANLNLTIDGDDHKIKGQIIIDGDGHSNGTETLTIKNVGFEGNMSDFCSGTDSFILAPNTKETGKPYSTGKYNYSHNITVTDCSFVSTSGSMDVVAYKSASGSGAYNITISNSTGTNLHSLAQFTGVTGANIINNNVTASDSFVNVSGGTGDYCFTGNTFVSATDDGYGIRLKDATTVVALMGEGNSITASKPLVLSKKADENNKGTFIVTDGYYAGEITKIAESENAKFEISGGTFDREPNAEFIAEGSMAVKEGDLWKVVSDEYVASISDSEGTVYYESFAEAAAAAGSEMTIKLLKNISDVYMISPDETLLVEKNGKSITVKVDGPYVVKTSTTDGVTKYTVVEADIEYTTAAGVVSYKTYSSTVLSGSGTYKLLKDVSVTARMTPGTLASSVVLDLNGHTITSTASDCVILLSRNGSEASHKTFEIIDSSEKKGGKIIAANPNVNLAIQASGKYNDITIGEGVIIEGEGIAVLSEHQTLNVYGTINAGNDFAVSTNGSTTKDAVINIYEGAVLTSDIIAVYLPGDGTTNISGGTITGATAVYQKSGELNITGGTLHGTGAAADYTHFNDGADATGDALVIENCSYPAGVPAPAIMGGVFISDNADPIGSYAYGEGNEPVMDYIRLDDKDSFYTNKEISDILPDGYICAPVSEGEYAGLYEVTAGYTVNFDTNGGMPAEIAPQKVLKGEKAEKPSDPQMEGYSFLGWYDGETLFDFTAAVTENVTLKAEWSLNVAKINDVFYPSLAAAVADAQPDDTVILLTDTSVEGIVIDKKITLDLNEKEVSSDDIQVFTVEEDGDLTITGNGKITGPEHGENFDGKSLICVNGGTLTIENGTLTATGSGSDGMYGIYVLNGGTAIFGTEDGNGPVITSHFAAIGTNNTTAPATITVYGGTYTANAVPANNEWWYYFCAPVYAAASGTFNLQGGTFNGYYGLSSRYVNVKQDVNIGEDVTVNASSGIALFVDIQTGSEGTSDKHIQAENDKLTLPEGYVWNRKADDLYEVVKVSDAVASISKNDETVYYFTLAEAVEAASNGDTVVLLADTEAEEIEVDKKIILDLKGHAVSSDTPGVFAVTQNGDLTITGEGSIKGPENGEIYDSQALITVDGGKLTIENGTLTATGSGSDGMYGVYIFNGGTAIFGTEDGNGPAITSHFAAIGTNHMTAPATITVYGGTYTANAVPANNEWWYYFCAPVYAAAAGTFTIKGGTFNGYYGISDRYADVEQTFIIESGTYNASSGIAVFVDEVNGSGAAADRHIRSEDNSLSLPDGYAWKRLEEGVYEITEAVCRIGDVYFASVNDAKGSDNTSSDTIVLLKDVKEYVYFDKNWTLDLAGHTITESGWVTLFVASNVHLTVEDSVGGGKVTNTFAGTNNPPANAIYTIQGYVVINGGTIQSDNSYGIYVNDGRSVIVNGGTIIGASDRSFYASRKNYFTINGGSFSDDVGNTKATLPAGKKLALNEETGFYTLQDFYTVTFDVDGGAPVPEAQEVIVDKTAAEPEAPKKEGYTFLGWYLGEEQYDFETPVKADIELKAKWAAVTWELTLPYMEGTLTETGAYFENLVLDFYSADPSVGRMQDGWWVGVKFVAPEAVTENNIADTRYSVNDGTWNSFNEAKDGQEEDGRYYMQAWMLLTVETVEQLAREQSTKQWIFKFRWDGSEDSTQTFVIEVSPENIELRKNDDTDPQIKVVGWEIIDENKFFNVNFDSAGGSEVTAQSVRYRDKAVEPETPVREFYLFRRWLKDGEVYDFNSPVTGDLTLTAEWADDKNSNGIPDDEEDFGEILPEDRPMYEEDIPKGLWITELKDLIYTGSKLTQEFRVYDYKKMLILGKDYTVSYKNNIKAGTATVKVTGKGNYKGSLTATFKILPAEINGENTVVILNKDCFVWNGKVQKPTVTAQYKGKNLKNKTDYDVVFITEPAGDLGNYSLKIVAKGNYTGEVETGYSIIAGSNALYSISKATVSGIKNADYTGLEITFGKDELVVKDGKNVLTAGTDYEVSYRNNVNAGTAYVIIDGIGRYKGEIIKSFKIAPIKLTAKNTTVDGIPESVEYHGKTELETVVKYGKKELVEGTDYTVSYKNNTKAGTATVTYKGIGNYSGSFNKTFKITPIDLNKNTITVAEIEDQPYQKGGNKPDIDAYDSDNRTQLVLNKDYTLSYKNNTKQGTATVTVKGKGNYTGTLNRTFKIVPADIGNVTATAQDKAYANKVNAYKSTIVLTDLNGKKLKVGTDYDKNVTYTYAASGQPVGANDIPDADTVITVTAKGLGNYTGTVSADYRIVKASIAKASVKVPNQTYTGNPITLKKEEITVKVGKDVLKPEDFEIVSYSNNVNKGTATVVIKGVGNNGGTKTVKFKIVQRNFCQLIRFNANAEGATGKMTSQFIFANTKLKANAFKCPGKTFVGWSVDPNTSPDDVQNIIPNKGVFPYELKKAGLITDLYAIWK